MGIDPSLSEPEIMLEASILVSRMRRAGNILPVWSKPLPQLELVENERQSSAALARLFEQLIEEDQERLMHQLMVTMEKYHVVLPGSMLPMLLQKAVNNSAFAKMISPVLGSRGKWLAKQHPEWSLLFFTPEQFSWETGDYQERLALLKYWREEDPAVGLHLLERTWKEETVAHQKAFLKCLSVHLSLADEDFLEQALDSKRKEIRQLAANLLAEIKDSALVKRMFDRAKELVQLNPKSTKQKLNIELPDTPDKALLRDGLDNKKQWHQGGLKASRLWQILSIIPPQYWMDHFELSARELLEVYVRSEWSQLLVQAMIDAATRHKDEEWIEVLVDFWLNHYHKQRWVELKVNDLFTHLHPLSYERLVLKALRKNVTLPEEEDPLINLLLVENQIWSEQLSQKILIAVRGWIGAEEMRYWGGWYLKNVLKNAAYCAEVKLYDRIRRSWNNAGPVWTSWENDVEDFFDIYEKRFRMNNLLSNV